MLAILALALNLRGRFEFGCGVSKGTTISDGTCVRQIANVIMSGSFMRIFTQMRHYVLASPFDIFLARPVSVCCFACQTGEVASRLHLHAALTSGENSLIVPLRKNKMSEPPMLKNPVVNEMK